ncbi:sulfite oxidase-like oxidoreductase [Halogeometricum pallidum JCM 14848]|uniref:Sulfite oxidase-like oxidoreductase n=1 Tax=Halogeometricum pallidum JCM 14848 TaxID=1227487 RepID=M0CV56_HALPD|nr:molybdopterin-dependent oxidoreductase [Halogeometricum pallidum]ELZ27100.1 sulfite oxidase-like oxidoreductase [Halogeometricum pallidum JCM 14848]
MARNRSEWRHGSTLLVALFAGIAAVAGSYAAAGFTPAFVVAPVEAFLTRTVPDAVLRFAITTLGTFAGIEHFGQLLNLAMALGFAAALLAAAALAALVVGRRLDSALASVGLTGLFAWGLTASLTGAPALSLGAGLGGALVVAGAELASASTGVPSGGADAARRRRLLGGVGTAVGVGAVGFLLGRSSSSAGADAGSGPSADVDGGASDDGSGGADAADADAGDADAFGDPEVTARYLEEAENRALDVEGLEGLVSGNFYTVDIGNVDPKVSADEWSLSVTGAVEHELSLTYADLRAMGAEQRFVTLRCVSDKVNAKLMDTDLWTGVAVSKILERANPQANYVMLRAADDYFVGFPLDALETGFLAYGKGGEALPRAHGHPVRALIPGHWGEVNTKWITEIEVLENAEKGFWEKRGWHGTGPVNTVAKLHATNRHDGEIQVAGHAYAGVRGIDRVEVSTDGGETWTDATLSEPLPAGTDEDGDAAEDAWRQWEHTYDDPGTKHTVVVRAVDGTGTLQPREEDGPYPSGATGWVSKTVSG